MKTRYRIVTDDFAGFEVQIKRWWLPIWFQCHHRGMFINTFGTQDKALEFIKARKSGNVNPNPKVVLTDL